MTLSHFSPVPVRQRMGPVNAFLGAAVIGAVALTVTFARADNHGTDGGMEIHPERNKVEHVYLDEVMSMIGKMKQTGQLNAVETMRLKKLHAMGGAMLDPEFNKPVESLTATQ